MAAHAGTRRLFEAVHARHEQGKTRFPPSSPLARADGVAVVTGFPD